MSEAPMTLRIVTPAGAAVETGCDSIQLTVPDGADGQGGGWLGIQQNHAPAVLALGRGPIRAYLDGEPVYLAQAEDGFVSVWNNVVTVITDTARSAEQGEATKE